MESFKEEEETEINEENEEVQEVQERKNNASLVSTLLYDCGCNGILL